MQSCTLSKNYSESDGGAIYIDSESPESTGLLTLQNTTATTTANITPALLTVSARNANKRFGTSNPSFSYSLAGFVGGYGSSTISGNPLLTTTATTASAPGSNAIIASRGSLSAANYTFAYVNGTLTIVSAGILVLNPTASGALTVSGNSVINETANVFVDSSSPTAIVASGNASITAAATEVVGGVQITGHPTFLPAPLTGVTAMADPFMSLAAPSGGTLQGAVNLGGNSSLTINPGVFSSITVSGNAKLTLNPGTYAIAGGGFSVTGNATVTGTGVLIFNAGTSFPNAGGSFGSITLSGNALVKLTPATTGNYAGIGIFQARDNTKTIAISGNAQLGVQNSGILYAPAALVDLSGNSNMAGALIANQLALSGNADPSPKLPKRSANVPDEISTSFVFPAWSLPLAVSRDSAPNQALSTNAEATFQRSPAPWQAIDDAFASQVGGDLRAPAGGQAIDDAFAALARGHSSGATDNWTALFHVHEDGSLPLWDASVLA